MSTSYQICARCIHDNRNDKFIEFDNNGVCNHCNTYDSVVKSRISNSSSDLEHYIAQIIKSGEGKKYDCVIGVSGGVDSTYVAHLTKELGLRPLAVHLDNGWNSELATQNITNILNKLNIDLYTHVINWEEFKDLQLSYFKASVIDIEVPTDHAIVATLYKVAKKYGIEYVITGLNSRTEGILPRSWIHNKLDLMNLKDIHKKYGKVSLKTFPTIGFFYYNYLTKIKSFPILDYVEYEKSKAKEIIIKEFDWRDYGGKHYESIFTRFYQAYILPVKFKVDKRRSHLSTLICAGQMSRVEALEAINQPPAPDNILQEDKAYVIKKWGLTEQEFDKYMSMPERPHMDFKSDLRVFHRLKPIRTILKKLR